jgi:hypothetical protein
VDSAATAACEHSMAWLNTCGSVLRSSVGMDVARAIKA